MDGLEGREIYGYDEMFFWEQYIERMQSHFSFHAFAATTFADTSFVIMSSLLWHSASWLQHLDQPQKIKFSRQKTYIYIYIMVATSCCFVLS